MGTKVITVGDVRIYASNLTETIRLFGAGEEFYATLAQKGDEFRKGCCEAMELSTETEDPFLDLSNDDVLKEEVAELFLAYASWLGEQDDRLIFNH